MERLKIEFPQLTRIQLDDCDRFILLEEFEKKRKKAVIRDWNREKLQLKDKVSKVHLL